MELGSRAFDMLLVLVEHHGRLVTKSTLLERVWPRLVVDENNISDSDCEPETCPRCGRHSHCAGVWLPSRARRLGSESIEREPQPIATCTPASRRGFTMTASRMAEPVRIALVGREDDLRDVRGRSRSIVPGDHRWHRRRREDSTRPGNSGDARRKSPAQRSHGFPWHTRRHRPRPLGNRSGTRDLAA